jgi:hypothetical protein
MVVLLVEALYAPPAFNFGSHQSKGGGLFAIRNLGRNDSN